MYGRALFILAAVQGLALIIENSYDNSILFVWMCTYSCGLQNSSTYQREREGGWMELRVFMSKKYIPRESNNK